MNRLVFNYKATVTRVLDGRDFDVILDLGFHTYRDQRLRLQNMQDLPDRKDSDPLEAATAVAAYKCLDKILVGRKVIISPTRPDRFDRAHCLIYIRARREIVGICDTFAGRRFLNVYKLMMWLQSQHVIYSVELAKQKLEETEVFDA